MTCLLAASARRVILRQFVQFRAEESVGSNSKAPETIVSFATAPLFSCWRKHPQAKDKHPQEPAAISKLRTGSWPFGKGVRNLERTKDSLHCNVRTVGPRAFVYLVANSDEEASLFLFLFSVKRT